MKSQNGGATWTLLSTTAWVNNGGPARVKLAAAPNTSTVWVITGENQGHGVYYSTAGGNKGWGRRTSLTDNNGSQTWMYDLHGRVSSTAQTINGAPATYTTSFTYDAMERVRTMTYPDGEVVTQTYNAQGLLDTLGSYVTASNYNATSQLTSLTFGNGLQTTYGYDAQTLRLTSLQTSGSNQNLSYTYDNAGNVKTITDNLLSQVSQFNYDDLNRLQDASISGVYAQAWSYDAIGNMSSFTDAGNVKTYSYTDTAHKHAVTQVGSNYFCYDANGNMTRRNATSGTCTNGDTLSYDVENRLTSITVGATTTNYFYNGDGARVKKTVNGVTTYYVGNLYEYTVWTGGSSTSKYYYFGGQRVAVKQDINVSYIHGDHLGSTSKTTDASASTQTYYPFGSIRTSSGTTPTDSGFTGQKRDASANLMFYGARYYDPALGRFIQPDTIVPQPMDPQSLNRYSYVRNNPINLIDPSGHAEEPACQSWDAWCWENRWYTAHGYCYSDKTEIWSRACKPSFLDPDIAAEVGANILEDASFGRIVDFKKYFDQLVEAAMNAVSPQVATAYESILAAFAAVGEVESFCFPNQETEICGRALASIPLAAKSRLSCNTTTGNDCLGQTFAGGDMIATILAYINPNTGKYSQFEGLNHWIAGTKTLSNETTFSIFYKALSVSEQIFTENYIETGLTSDFVDDFGLRPWFGTSCGGESCYSIGNGPGIVHYYWLK